MILHTLTVISSSSLPVPRQTGLALWAWCQAPRCCSADAEEGCCASGTPTHLRPSARSGDTTVPSTVWPPTAANCSLRQSESQAHLNSCAFSHCCQICGDKILSNTLNLEMEILFNFFLRVCVFVFFWQWPHSEDLGSQRISGGRSPLTLASSSSPNSESRIVFWPLPNQNEWFVKQLHPPWLDEALDGSPKWVWGLKLLVPDWKITFNQHWSFTDAPQGSVSGKSN